MQVQVSEPVVGAAAQNIMQCMKQGVAKVVELYSLILWTSYSSCLCPAKYHRCPLVCPSSDQSHRDWYSEM